MKIDTISNANAKGQVVIPKAIRDKLQITKDTLLQIKLTGQTISIAPIKEVIPVTENDILS